MKNVVIFFFDYILDFSAPSPPPHKISNNILIYLTFYRILQLVPPPLPVIKIVKYCGVWGGGGGHWGRQNPIKDICAPSLCH